MFKLIETIHTVNGFKHKSVYMEFEDGSCNYIACVVETPHCGWVPDNCDPSFECKKCDESCIEYKKWEDFYKTL